MDYTHELHCPWVFVGHMFVTDCICIMTITSHRFRTFFAIWALPQNSLLFTAWHRFSLSLLTTLWASLLSHGCHSFSQLCSRPCSPPCFTRYISHPFDYTVYITHRLAYVESTIPPHLLLLSFLGLCHISTRVHLWTCFELWMTHMNYVSHEPLQATCF